MERLPFQNFDHLMWKAYSWEKILILGKIEGKEEKGAADDETAGMHYWFSGHDFEQFLGDSEGQGSLVCCSPLGYKELDTTKQQQQYLHPTYFI